MSKRVLIVEDDFLIATSIDLIVETAGMTVVGTARNLSEAVAQCASLAPDFATMDIKLDGPESGIEVADRLFREFGVRSLFISAYAPEQRATLVQSKPALGWVDKPFRDEDLMRALASAAASL